MRAALRSQRLANRDGSQGLGDTVLAKFRGAVDCNARRAQRRVDFARWPMRQTSFLTRAGPNPRPRKDKNSGGATGNFLGNQSRERSALRRLYRQGEGSQYAIQKGRSGWLPPGKTADPPRLIRTLMMAPAPTVTPSGSVVILDWTRALTIRVWPNSRPLFLPTAPPGCGAPLHREKRPGRDVLGPGLRPVNMAARR